MLIAKRLLLWLAEIISQALLLALLLAGLFGHDQFSFGRGVVIYASWIFIMFCVTGYALTTAIARAVWRGESSKFYPILTAVLFVLHFELLNVGIGGAFAPPDRRTVVIAGAVTAFVTALAGTLLSRRPASRLQPQ